MTQNEFKKQSKEFIELVDYTLDLFLSPPPSQKSPKILYDAMRDAVGSGGKRIRPLICFGAAIAAGGDPNDARYAAAAIELLHTYTLVHDDLPAMDNDEMRRGKPSTWKAFGEANAILVGDMLQALAFDILSFSEYNVDRLLVQLSRGARNVVRGQVLDLQHGEVKLSGNRKIDYILKTYDLKTGALFSSAAGMGAAAVNASISDEDGLSYFGCAFGRAFQFQDDLLDGDSIFPNDELEARIDMELATANGALDSLPGDPSYLKALMKYLRNRKK